MRLVLDEHYSPAIAFLLRERGHEVVAAAELSELRSRTDEELLEWARGERRVVVTENVRDFMALHCAGLAQGEAHAGLLFTSPRAYPRRMDAVGPLVAGLQSFLEEHSETETLDGGTAWL